MTFVIADTSGVLIAKFALFDPSFWNAIIGPLLLVVAVWIGARAYTKTKTAEVGIATSGLLRQELDVAREAANRLQKEKDLLLEEVVELRRTRSMEPVMLGISEVMVTLTRATHDMVHEIKNSSVLASERQEAVMETIAHHEDRAQERHEKMMVPLQRMADTLTNGVGG